MLRDVTFGQYYPGNSFVHKMDAGVKLLLTLLYMVGIFFVPSFVCFGVLALFLLVTVLLARIPIKSVLKSLRGILFLLLFSAVLNLFFTKGDGDPLCDWWIFTIYTEGLISAGMMFLRLALLVTGANVLTLTTTPVALTHAIENLLKPLKVIKFPVHELALIMSLTLSFIPSLIDETDRIIRAQKARGANFDTGSLGQRVKAFVPILIPLLVGGFRRAEELAYAMNSRCYEGATKRTSLQVVKLTWRDLVGSLAVVVIFTAIFIVRAEPSFVSGYGWLYFGKL